MPPFVSTTGISINGESMTYMWASVHRRVVQVQKQTIYHNLNFLWVLRDSTNEPMNQVHIRTTTTMNCLFTVWLFWVAVCINQLIRLEQNSLFFIFDMPKPRNIKIVYQKLTVIGFLYYDKLCFLSRLSVTIQIGRASCRERV